jgi:putative colanic acid biosysnthesis UDP-glucose lipid carrier transferase
MSAIEPIDRLDWRAREMTTPPPVATSRTKRAIDLLLSAAALLLFLPLLVLIAMAIRCESRGEALFRQQRTGLNGRPFRIYKFRTMRVVEDGPQIEQARRYDARVTRIGRLLRKLSLDELPQLLNVLKGDMSLVGPRPHALCHDEAWSRAVPRYAERFRTRPGLTGFAQVCGLRGEVTRPDAIRQRVAADNAYIEGWSVMEDLKLIAMTVPLMFKDAAAY